jgi:hypothetical protein
LEVEETFYTKRIKSIPWLEKLLFWVHYQLI